MSNSQDIHKLLEHPIPTFNVLESGKRKETLIHCFLQRTTITYNPAIRLTDILAKNGEVYTIVWDCSVPGSIQNMNVIISFQKHTYGNFAIIRLVIQTEKPAEITFLSSYVGL